MISIKKIFHHLYFLIFVVQLVVSVVPHRVLGPVHGDALHVLVVSGGSRPHLVAAPNTPIAAHQAALGASSADCEPPWVIALPSDDLGQDSSSCINKPVANLGR